MQRFQLKTTWGRTVASVFVVCSPSGPGDRVKAIAAMTGGFMCTPEFMLTGSASSIAVKLQRAMGWPRRIFL